MKKRRLNNKGYMLVEIILASAIAFSVAYYLLNLIVKFKNKDMDVYESTSFISTKINITKNIMDDLTGKSVYLIDWNYEQKYIDLYVNQELKRIYINDSERTIQYGKYNKVTNEYDKTRSDYYKKEIPKYLEMGKMELNYTSDKKILKIILPLSNIYSKENSDLKIIIPCDKLLNSSHTYETIGHVGFAIAGANSATRGNRHGDYDNVKWLKKKNDITNYNTIINELIQNGTISDESKITNITGSNLNINGKLKKIYLGYFCYGSDGGIVEKNGKKTTVQTSFADGNNGKILIIKPNGKYVIIEPEKSGPWPWSEYLDITEKIGDDATKGWYHVAFINAGLAPQAAWGLFAVYEDNNLPFGILAIDVKKQSLASRENEINSIEFNFEKEISLKNRFQIAGLVLGGGIGAWPKTETETGDKFWAKLSDGSTKQLYENGDHFKGRTNTDFFNDTFSTENNIGATEKGGEMDIFNETLSSSYFDGKKVVGYRIEKTGTNGINIGIIGLFQELN